ncbi:hydroxymethylbilane synthase [bacterium]|nr:hydroxymethylbilane synthase [bacterium]
MKIVLGTRGSQLALRQSEIVISQLKHTSPQLQIELKVIKTTGDKNITSPMSHMDDKGLFVKEIEKALLEKKVDLAVHSLKDLPVDQPPGLQISALIKRESPYDVFVSNQFSSLEEMESGSILGTGSLRRKSQLLYMRPDLRVKEIRGNVETRLRKLDKGAYQGLILAACGLERLGLGERITQVLPVEKMIPAVGQGSLAVETRKGHKKINELCLNLHHEQTQSSIQEERKFLNTMGGGCQVPLGCYAFFKNNYFLIKGFIGDLEGKNIIFQDLKRKKEKFRGSGLHLAQILLNKGGRSILKKIKK